MDPALIKEGASFWYGSPERLASVLAQPTEALWAEWESVREPTFREFADAKSAAASAVWEELRRRDETAC